MKLKTTEQFRRPECLVAALMIVAASAHSQGVTVYRCPGPPVVYSDALTSQEARTKGCRAIDSRWFEAGGNSETTVYVDTQSMRRNGPKVKVWLKWTHAKPAETSSYPKKAYLSEKQLDIYHCEDRTSATVQAIRYAGADAMGEVVESPSISETSAQFRDLAPETIGESILEYVCTATATAKK